MYVIHVCNTLLLSVGFYMNRAPLIVENFKLALTFFRFGSKIQFRIILSQKLRSVERIQKKIRTY
jgi:hypothetical protein